MSPRKSFHVADRISCCRENHFMSPMEFHVPKSWLMSEPKWFHVGKMYFMSAKRFHVAKKVFHVAENLISCRRSDFMSPRRSTFWMWKANQPVNLWTMQTWAGIGVLSGRFLCWSIRKVDFLADMKSNRRHEIKFSATWKTVLATWNCFGDMKYILPTWNHFGSDMSQLLATWNSIGDMKWCSRRHEIPSATWNDFLGDMNQYWVTWNYFGDMKYISATWNGFGSDMSSFLATWNFIGVKKRFSRRHESLFGHTNVFRRHEASFFGHETFFPVMHPLSVSVCSTPPIRLCCQLLTFHDISTQNTTRRFSRVY